LPLRSLSKAWRSEVLRISSFTLPYHQESQCMGNRGLSQKETVGKENALCLRRQTPKSDKFSTQKAECTVALDISLLDCRKKRTITWTAKGGGDHTLTTVAVQAFLPPSLTKARGLTWSPDSQSKKEKENEKAFCLHDLDSARLSVIGGLSSCSDTNPYESTTYPNQSPTNSHTRTDTHTSPRRTGIRRHPENCWCCWPTGSELRPPDGSS
jgi:hypothetical protein